jgi:hypothetical protein
MRSNKFAFVLTFLIILSMACSFLSGLIPKSGTNDPVTQPPVASDNGPAGLTAKPTSADSVLLSWSAVDGAIAYNIRVSINGSNTISLIDLPASATSYSDFMAMPGSQLTYAVEAVGQAGSIGQSVVDVSTLTRQPNPLTVQAQFDEKASATQTIGAEGGSISLTDAKGVVYKLDIPAGALTDQTEVKLTAVNEIGGWPLDGEMLGGVKIEPEGLQLNDVAKLSITLPNGLPSDKLSTLGYVFSGSGQEFHLQPAFRQNRTTGLVPVPSDDMYLASFAQQGSPAEIIQTVLEFYGIGVGQGSAASAGNLVQNNAPSDAGAAMDQKQAAALAENNDIAALPIKTPKKIKNNQYDVEASIIAYGVQLAIAGADNCGDLQHGIVAFEKLRYLNDNKYLQNALQPDKIIANEKTIMENLADKIKELIDNAGEECKKSDGKGPVATAQPGCLETILDRIAEPPSNFYKDLQRQILNKYGNGMVADADNQLAKCLPSYTASGGSNNYAFSGTICSLRQPFKLKASGAHQFAVDFTPTSSLSGNVAAFASEGGCTDKGSGIYIVKVGSNGAGNITIKISGDTVACPGISKTNEVIQVVTITPLAEKPAECTQP